MIDKTYRSFAKWPKGTFDSQNNLTTDDHYSKEGAEVVAWKLRTSGMTLEDGRKVRAKESWVEPIKKETQL